MCGKKSALMLMVALLGIFGLHLNDVQARPHYYPQLQAAFPGSRLDAGIRCIACHNGRQLNEFGKDFAELVLRSDVRPYDFSVLRDIDSDGDGRLNIDEILAGTNPGKRD